MHYNNSCKINDYCYVEMPEENNKILKYNHGETSMKYPFIIYADLKCLLKKMDTCHNNPEKSSTTKEYEREAPGYSVFIQCLGFKRICNKNNNYEKEEMIPLTSEEKKLHRKQKVCYICKKNLALMMMMELHSIKSILKSEVIVIILKNIEELLMIFVV